MKKFILLIIGLVVILSGMIGVYLAREYQGEPYYALINKEASKVEDVYDTEGVLQDKTYIYTLDALNEQGLQKTITFQSIGRPLTQNKYLSLKYNEKKGVLSWHEVSKQEIPEKALSKLDN